VEFFAPVKWYLEQLKWSPERDPGQALDLEHLGTTFTELMRDFTFTTHIHMRKVGKDQKLTCGQATSVFAFCAKRIGTLCKGKSFPGPYNEQCRALAAFGFPRTSGLVQRAHLLCPDGVQMLLARQALLGTRHYDWIPQFGSLNGQPLWGMHNKKDWTHNWANKNGVPGPLRNRPRLKPSTKKSNRDIWEVKFQQKIQQHNASAKKHNKHVVEAETQRAQEPPDSVVDSDHNRKPF
jgi:hypothetical protein